MKISLLRFRLSKIKEATLTTPYLYLFFLIFVLYIVLDIFVNKIYVSFSTIFTNNLWIIIPFLLFTILIAVLVAININLIIIRLKELRQLKKESGLTSLGILMGILGGACPSCFVGLFPAVIGLFGISASLSSLPLFGIEIQVVSAILLLLSLFFLTGNNVCTIKIRRKK